MSIKVKTILLIFVLLFFYSLGTHYFNINILWQNNEQMNKNLIMNRLKEVERQIIDFNKLVNDIDSYIYTNFESINEISYLKEGFINLFDVILLNLS